MNLFERVHNRHNVRLRTLDIISESVSKCTDCKLHKTRTQTVFGSGNSEARIVLYGEAPGQDEDEQGLPFVGRAGKLLTEIIEAAGMKRDDMYIMNSVKCRPPNNRKPQPDEIKACRLWSRIQIEIIQPSIIVTLGATATEALCGNGLGITKRRGSWESYYESSKEQITTVIPIMPTLHPAYILRNPAAKQDIIDDLIKVKKRLEEGTGHIYTDSILGEECISVV